MKTKFCFFILFMGIAVSLFARQNGSDPKATNNVVVTDSTKSLSSSYSTIYISRSYTWQEWNTGSAKIPLLVYINDKPICEIVSQSRIAIKVFSEGKMNFSVKYVPTKKVKQKHIDKVYHSGPSTEIEVTHGKKYYLHVDMKDKNGILINVITSLISIPESENMFKEEDRFKKNPEIKECQEDISNPIIR